MPDSGNIMSDSIGKKKRVFVFIQKQMMKYWSTHLKFCPEQVENNILLVDGREVERDSEIN